MHVFCRYESERKRDEEEERKTSNLDEIKNDRQREHKENRGQRLYISAIDSSQCFTVFCNKNKENQS